MNGGGTSSSTPQVAAACALWIENNYAAFPPDWRRVQACRYALFNGAYKGSNSNPNKVDSYYGNGILDVPNMLAVNVDLTKLHRENQDTVMSKLWQSVMKVGPSTTNEELMYEVEAAQIVCRTGNPQILAAARNLEEGIRLDENNLKKAKQLLTEEPDISSDLQRKISGA
jgi:predicted metalloprotease with PDZ domain